MTAEAISIFDQEPKNIDGCYILDMTCGGRSIWFQKNHPRTVFFDRREVEYEQEFGTQASTRHIKVHPDVKGDFRHLPFVDETFNLVVFDPPHIVGGGERWLTKAYGQYATAEEAKESVCAGIAEAMRVLKPRGVLIFKWAETSIPTAEIIKDCGYQPLFGHRSGKKLGTHWMTFIKE